MAPKCAYCNAVTPKGRADAERAEQMARQQQVYAQHQAAAQASVNQALAAAEVNKFASYALFTTLPALVTCCAPVGWLGAFFAFRSLSVAKKNGIPAPARAIVAMVLAVLGSALTVTAFVGAHFDEKDKEKRIAALDAKSAQNRKKATLDAKTACDTTEIHLLKSGTMYVSAKMVCTGEPVVTGSTARLDGVSYVSNGKTEGPFRVVEVAGPLAFGLWGIMAEILAPLVDAHISVLAMSTFDTDWILVRTEDLRAAGEAWRRAGLIFTSTNLSGSLP